MTSPAVEPGSVGTTEGREPKLTWDDLMATADDDAALALIDAEIARKKARALSDTPPEKNGTSREG
jgi:hypothetical protein